VDVGSFAGTARKLGRATSVISYSIFYFWRRRRRRSGFARALISQI
jgi:hypothetical protein